MKIRHFSDEKPHGLEIYEFRFKRTDIPTILGSFSGEEPCQFEAFVVAKKATSTRDGKLGSLLESYWGTKTLVAWCCAT